MMAFYVAGAGALLLLIWAVCRTPASKREAENERARQLADRSRPQALFGPHHPHYPGEPTDTD